MPKVAISKRQRAAIERLLDTLNTPFRRSDMSKVLQPLTSPRSIDGANKIADVLLREHAAAGRIQRHGHLHWVRCSTTRLLLDESSVPERKEPMDLRLQTLCPEKWVAVDLETGEFWRGGPNGWRRPDPAALGMVAMAVARATKMKKG